MHALPLEHQKRSAYSYDMTHRLCMIGHGIGLLCLVRHRVCKLPSHTGYLQLMEFKDFTWSHKSHSVADSLFRRSKYNSHPFRIDHKQFAKWANITHRTGYANFEKWRLFYLENKRTRIIRLGLVTGSGPVCSCWWTQCFQSTSVDSETKPLEPCNLYVQGLHMEP